MPLQDAKIVLKITSPNGVVTLHITEIANEDALSYISLSARCILLNYEAPIKITSIVQGIPM